MRSAWLLLQLVTKPVADMRFWKDLEDLEVISCFVSRTKGPCAWFGLLDGWHHPRAVPGHIQDPRTFCEKL